MQTRNALRYFQIGQISPKSNHLNPLNFWKLQETFKHILLQFIDQWIHEQVYLFQTRKSLLKSLSLALSEPKDF